MLFRSGRSRATFSTFSTFTTFTTFKSARSSVARNGLMALDDLMATCGNKIKEKSVVIAETLLESCASNQPKVIRLAATTALDTASMAGPLTVPLAPALAKLVSHKNRDVQQSSMIYTCKCVQAMSEEQIKDKLDMKKLLPLVFEGFTKCKAPEIGRAHV